MRRLVIAVAALGPLAVVGVAGADGTPLNGSVGPGFSISLKDASNVPVSHLDPGAYSLTVTDLADSHNFHLQGPGGTDVATGVDTTGTQTFALNLVDGTYRFFCDAHPSTMKGSFTVGTASTPPPPPPTTPPPSSPPPAASPKLALTVTSSAVTLRRAGGAAVRRLAPGSYSVKVVDRSAKQNAHLVGAGVNRKTGIAFVGTVTWKVKLRKGSLVYRSDAAKPKLRPGKVAVSGSASS
jgi:hypothetical protein